MTNSYTVRAVVRVLWWLDWVTLLVKDEVHGRKMTGGLDFFFQHDSFSEWLVSGSNGETFWKHLCHVIWITSITRAISAAWLPLWGKPLLSRPELVSLFFVVVFFSGMALCALLFGPLLALCLLPVTFTGDLPKGYNLLRGEAEGSLNYADRYEGAKADPKILIDRRWMKTWTRQNRTNGFWEWK